MHQLYVWFCWRTQLHYSLITKLLGPKGLNFYAAGFSILGITRTSLVFLLGAANSGSLQVDQTLLNVVAAVIAVPAVYLFYSVRRYFGVKRAMGIDHFDESYRSKPFVKKGIFRFTSNGMYTFGFLLLWIPGLVFASKAALLAAAFNHTYIWVHYFCTELPDIRRIYGGQAKS